MKVIISLIFIIQSFIALYNCQYISAPYADWAHSHVVWYNNSQTQQKIFQMAENYFKHQIPFGGFNIDSGWSTCYNDFNWNKKLFPDPQGLIDYFHKNNVKVMLWATSMINSNCQTYQYAKNKGYLLNNGKLAKWWHGQGAFLDFFNPQATKWWQSLMEKIIDMGVDAWKCDGTDPLIVRLRPWAFSNYKKRYIMRYQYSHIYYGTFYNFTKSKNPNALIMARPVDSPTNGFYLPYAPKYVMFSGWVGDQNSTTSGIKAALENVMHSAWKGYLNFGFDIGGYKTRKQVISKNLFLRWAQVGSMVPFMQNGGQGFHQPWAFDSETVNIYRKFVLVHYDLKSFFLTAGTQAYKKGVSVIQPLAKKSNFFISPIHITNFGYILWDTFLVFPIVETNNIADMEVPEGTWIYYFDHSWVIDKRNISRAFPLDQFPVFINKGSIYPVQRSYLNQQYMKNFKQSNKDLLQDEIVLVYLDKRSHNKVFLHGQYTDYVHVQILPNQMTIKVDRFYKDKNNFTKKSSSQFAQIKNQINIQNDKEITIRVVGAQKNLNLEIISSKQTYKTNNIGYKFEEKLGNDLVFDIVMNQTYKISNFKFRSIQINKQ